MIPARYPSLRAAPLGRLLRSRLASAMLWNGIAAVLARGLPVLGMMITARILGSELFGQLGIVYQTVMTCQVFASAGLGTTATTFVARWRHEAPGKVPRLITLCYGLPVALGAALMVGFLFGADWLARAVLLAPELADMLRLGGVLTVMVAVVAVQQGVLIGFQAFRDMAVANLISGISTGAALAAGAYQGGVGGALYGFGAALMVQFVVNQELIRRAMRLDGLSFRLAIPRNELPLLWTFSLPSVLTMAIWMLASWAASVLLVRQPDGLAEMGLLAAANQWFSALMFVPGVLTQVLLPTYAHRLADGRPAEAGALALRSAAVLLLGISPIVALLVYLSPFLAALYGPGFAHGGAVFALACLAAGIMAPCGALNNYVVARERMWPRLAISLLWSATLLAGAFLLVSWGALGVSVATLVAYAVRAGATYLYAKRLMRG